MGKSLTARASYFRHSLQKEDLANMQTSYLRIKHITCQKRNRFVTLQTYQA